MEDKVNFVIIDLDKPQSPAQLRLVQRYYEGSIPDLIVLDGDGKPVYNQAGEQSEEVLSHILDSSDCRRDTKDGMVQALPKEMEWIARILRGERDLFHELIRPYERAVFMTAVSVLRDSQRRRTRRRRR